MTKINIALLFLVVLFSSGNVFSQEKTGERFRKPLDEETREKEFINESFSDFVPQPGSSVFLNYNISNNPAPQNETSVKISRKDPNRVVAAWRDFRISVTPANRRVGYSYSSDGGITWSVSQLLDSTLLPGFPRNSDPVVTTDTSGNFYIAVITIGGTGALAIYKSTDGGVTFPNAYMIANDGSEDKEYMETDFTPGSPYLNSIYISWTRFSGVRGIKLTKSTDEGVNWTSAVPVSDVTLGNQGSDVAVGLDGEVYVCWLDGNTANDVVMFDKSTDGGNTFGTDKNIAQGPPPNIPISSSGVTFPSIAADITSGPYSGYIYVTFCDSRNGDPDVFLTRSTNRGVNWSAPVRVNNDPVGNGKLQCWPWIGVNDSGNIAITFFDSRNTSSNTIIENFVAHSSDGGLTFQNLQVSTVPTPTAQPNFDVRFGDYIGIDYYRDMIVPVWTDERAGGFDMECYTGIISTPVNINNLVSEIPDNYKLFQNYPNPFNPNTVIRYSVAPQNGSLSLVSLKVYNSLGSEVATLVDRKQSNGNYEVNFSGSDLSSGIYFYKLQTEGFVQTKSMLLIK
ncbi:MAG TPA: T9SS type A sorting domain-containing protein [Ignavibacteria bacterium]|nr:T9SS type A sorting domain-containing protein [Ignavibacteria bacterium]HMR40608.1 T9SS type A sorting domain-containing protein [Ignavibacteria bacterium]